MIIFGATGSLGGHVLRQAFGAGYGVTVLVRDPSKLSAEARERMTVYAGDLNVDLPPDIVSGQDVLINCAGHVAKGKQFVNLIDRVVTAVETLPAGERPVCWFLAGAALLDIDASGRRAVELPKVKSTYWPHRVNFERLARAGFDWRLLCPGPMVEGPALGPQTLRVSLDRLPVKVPAFVRALPRLLVLPVFASLISEMIVSYADAAALMLANLDRDSPMARHRVGLALPAGMRGRKRE